MTAIWKKRKGHWYLIDSVGKKLENITTDENGEENKSYKYEQGILWYKHNGKWIDILNPEKDFITTGDSAHDYIESIEDGDMVTLTCRNLYVKRGHTLTTSNRCKGLILNITGDLIVVGNLSMTKRGCIAEGRYVGIDYVNKTVSISETAETNPFLANTFKISVDSTHCTNCNSCVTSCKYDAISLNNIEGTSNIVIDYDKCVGCGLCADVCLSNNTELTNVALTKEQNILDNHYVISPVGGLGRVNAAGNPGVNGACGAGGGEYKAVGGNGTSFSGGSGAGGAFYGDPYVAGYAGSSIGGPGGDSRYTGGGGAGNPGGAGGKRGGAIQSKPGYPGEDGTGGLLIAFVEGNIITYDTGVIESNGSRGGQNSSSWYDGNTPIYAQGGGGSGGGAIHIFHKGSINNYSSIKAIGGLGGGTNSYRGTKGGDGTVHIAKVLEDNKLHYPQNI